MRGAASFNITSFPFFLILTITTFILTHPSTTVIAGSNDGIPIIPDDNRPPPTAAAGKKSDALKPSAAVVVGVLTTTFSLSFLLLLYIKHCSGSSTIVARGDRNSQAATAETASSEQRKDSGVGREVVESLPKFRFGSLRGRKNGLDCAVCLAGFEEREVLRLLPKCRHAFHVDCVDMWLHAHSTCPLCRYKVLREDAGLAEDAREEEGEEEAFGNNIIEGGRNNDEGGVLPENENRRGSGRDSSDGEGEEEFIEIVLQSPKNDAETPSFRGSLEELEDAVASPGKSVGPLRGMMSGEHRLEHQIIVSPSSSRGGGHEKDSSVESLDVLYLKSEEMIIGDGRRTASERKQNVRRGERENGVLRSVSEAAGMNNLVKGKNRGKGRG
ncbi:RING-H2 finger protein ATL43-like [Lotus japonicus]|uniref:RING-H2 finger protein ATL43-like n=1 Tax=Lotus japonicus TaxID=34305 RepID=UPI00258AA8EB|nr:RING-H2 finger protein ATL43-like [Lotus japonicus]